MQYHFKSLEKDKSAIRLLAMQPHRELLNASLPNTTQADYDEAMNTYKKSLMGKWYPQRTNLDNEADEYLKLLVKDFFVYLRKNIMENAGLPITKENFLDVNEDEAKRKYETGKKFTLFSGHDMNIINIISNLFDDNWLVNNVTAENFEFFAPRYASSLIFELVKKNGQFYVRIVFNGKILKKYTGDTANKWAGITSYKLRVSNQCNDINGGLIPEDGLIKIDTFLDVLKNRISHVILDCSEPDGGDEEQ